MLTIRVITYKGTAVEAGIGAQFGDDGGSIGRSPECTLVLPDPDRVVSRTHAVVTQVGGRFSLRDQGSTVAVFVNGTPLGKGRERTLATGDELRIAGYALVVEDAATARVADEDSTTILREGTLLSWSEGDRPEPASRIASVIVPAPAGVQPVATAASDVPAARAAGAPAPALSAAPASVAASAPAADDALLAALLRGAGVPELDVVGGLTPRFMEDLGALMRETMRGLLDLLSARANAKREVRADATVIVAQDNNPLKFAPDIDTAVAHLFAPPAPGFMGAQRSLADARASLCLHHEGFVAGMRAALQAVLQRFDPAALEARLQETAPASFLALNQKARLWSQYEALYAAISGDAQTDFHFLFGEEFLAAYQARARPAPVDSDVA